MKPTRVTIDKNRIMHIDGNPFFPVLARHIPEGGTPKLLAEAGFNGYRWTAFGTETVDTAPVPDQNEGIYFYAYIYDRAVLGQSGDYKGQLQELTRSLRDDPAFLCYENFTDRQTFYFRSQELSCRAVSFPGIFRCNYSPRKAAPTCESVSSVMFEGYHFGSTSRASRNSIASRWQ